MNTKVVVHVGSKQRKYGAEQASEDAVGREHRSGVDGVGVDKVVHYGQENEHLAEAERGGEDDAGDPVDARVVCPGEDEET